MASSLICLYFLPAYCLWGRDVECGPGLCKICLTGTLKNHQWCVQPQTLGPTHMTEPPVVCPASDPWSHSHDWQPVACPTSTWDDRTLDPLVTWPTTNALIWVSTTAQPLCHSHSGRLAELYTTTTTTTTALTLCTKTDICAVRSECRLLGSNFDLLLGSKFDLLLGSKFDLLLIAYNRDAVKHRPSVRPCISLLCTVLQLDLVIGILV